MNEYFNIVLKVKHQLLPMFTEDYVIVFSLIISTGDMQK